MAGGGGGGGGGGVATSVADSRHVTGVSHWRDTP